jgi:hypothetical protein
MRLVCALLTLVAAVPPAPAFADDAVVAVSVQVSARTSLRVSSDVLQFTIDESGADASAVVDFTAAARVPGGSGIVLTVEPLRAVEGPGGAADVETAVTFAGEGEGTLAGSLSTGAADAAKWRDSGTHTGRLVFTLHASAPGVYSVPVRLVLSTP